MAERPHPFSLLNVPSTRTRVSVLDPVIPHWCVRVMHFGVSEPGRAKVMRADDKTAAPISREHAACVCEWPSTAPRARRGCHAVSHRPPPGVAVGRTAASGAVGKLSRDRRPAPGRITATQRTRPVVPGPKQMPWERWWWSRPGSGGAPHTGTSRTDTPPYRSKSSYSHSHIRGSVTNKLLRVSTLGVFLTVF